MSPISPTASKPSVAIRGRHSCPVGVVAVIRDDVPSTRIVTRYVPRESSQNRTDDDASVKYGVTTKFGRRPVVGLEINTSMGFFSSLLFSSLLSPEN